MSSKTEKRAKEIVRLLLQNPKTSVDELTAALRASPASIRRDLTRLEEQGLVHRTHGGAMLANVGKAVYEPFRFDASFQVREDRFAPEKQRIARAAGALVQENETIGISAGTTTTLVARQLISRKRLHVITNAVNIGMELGSCSRLQTTLTGGIMRWVGAFSLVGPAAVESLAVVVMDRLFLGVTGIDPKYGATMIEAEEAAVFRAMAQQAKQIIVVADSSKMGQVSPAVVCSIDEIDMIITDDGISAEASKALVAKGVQLLVV
jgi:DeoR family transcriptional regulator, aga operon transcriptional repressor